ncbi:uncharacterized protein LOC133182755 [Saccostrea echinata]|uniref:uncharacterized protein LOC133182755 n=1 Tax=Saccostrea echinata TaxID=191078 RepID=UPI002A81A0FA|nr:uncharacterized protein LOC133182755 [Saccostrea echinata]
MKAYCNETKADFRKVPFNITIEMDGSATIEFDLDSGKLAYQENSTMITEDNRNKTRDQIQINYTEYGFKMPKFIGHNNKFAEEIYLDDYIIADYDLEKEIELQTSAEKRNQTVPLPPGNISILIGISPHLKNSTRPLINCSINTGDEVKRVDYTQLHNITINRPLIVYHTYYDLGNQTIDAKCHNFISNVDLHLDVRVINVCYGDEGIFDRQFSMQSKKMSVFDSSEVYIANRMSIFCPGTDITFGWENCSSLIEREGVCMFNASILPLGAYEYFGLIEGIDGPAFALEGNILTPGRNYTLLLTAVKQNETNKLAISANCTNWKPETYPVLAYLFETITKRKTAYGDIEDIVNYLYKGYEGSILETPIQVGDSQFNSSVTFRVRVYNEHDDYFKAFEQTYSVSTPTKSIPYGGHDKEPVLNLYQEFNMTVEFIRRGGDVIRTFRYIGSIASTLLPYKQNISVTTEKEILDGTKTSVTFYKDSDAEKLYKDIIHQMIVVLSEEGKTCSKWTYKKFSLTDIHQIFSSIDAVVRNPSYLSFETLEKLIVLVEDMIRCFTIRIDETEIPFPNYYVHTIEEITKHIVRVVNIIVDVMLPENLQDFSEELSQENILNELKTKKFRSDRQLELINRNLTEGELNDLIQKSYLILQLREHERDIQSKQINMSETYYKRIQGMLTHVQATLLTTLVTGEKMEFHQPYLKLIVQKTTYTEFKKANVNNTKLQKYILGITHGNSSVNLNSIVEVKIIVFGKNPLIFGENASSLTSDVFVYDFGDETVMDVKLRNRGKPQPYDFSPLYSPSIGELITHFYFDVMNDDDAILIYIKPHNFLEDISSERLLYRLFISPKPFPTTTSFRPGRDYQTETAIRNWDTELGYKIFVPNGFCLKGVCYMGIKPLKETMSSRTRREAVHVLSANRSVYNKNSTVDPVDANFTLQVITTACRAWDKTSNTWESNRCEVLSMTTVGETVCRCTGHIFSTTFYVPPNMIDLYKVWGKFNPANASVYGAMIAVLVIYLLLALILRREDKKDIERWAIAFLCDHDSEDCYFYMITVYTGLRRRAGTTSNIHFVLSGSEDESGIRMLSDGERKGLPSGSIVTFVFGTKHSLGDLEYFRIWHDCSGQGPRQDWFLSKIEIDDLQTNERSIFLCDNWLSLDQEDGLIERVLPVSTVESLMAFKTLVAHQTQLNITDHHLWLSLLFRPRKSRFTRVQRLSCVLALLFLSMISNAMYYKSAEEEATYDYVQIGVFRLSVSALFVSLIGIVLTTFPILFLTILFRNRRLKANKTETEASKDKKEISTTQSFRIPSKYIKEHEKSLPHWILYVAWMILSVIVLVSAFFLLLYSMEWGKAKSEEWLMSFFLSFFESILFVDPIKVLFVAVLFATVFKAIIYEKTAEVDIDQLKNFSTHFKNSDKHRLAAFASNILRGPDQLTQDELEQLKAKRQEEKRAKKALTKLIIFAVYLFGLYSISFLERDFDSFHYKSNIDSFLYSSGNEQLGFSSINRTEDYINWLYKTFIPTFYPLTNYAGDELGVIDQQRFKDRASIRIGPAQLRQLRTERASCPFTRITWPYPCIHEYSDKYADTAEYCFEWKPYDSKCGKETNRIGTYYTAGAWKYTDAENIWGIAKSGEYGTYDGGGYIMRFTKNYDRAKDLVKEIVEKNWIDRNTRAVFLEFTLYNPNRNLFIHAIYLAEFIEIGGIMKWTETQAFRPIVSADMVGSFTILCYLIFLSYLVITTINVFFKVKGHGFLSFIKQPWNLVIILNIFLSYACVAVYIVRVTFAKQTMKEFYDNKLSLKINDEFINFNHIVIWDNVFNAFFAIIVFLSTIQLLKILGYNKRFTQIISVVVNAKGNIGGFGFLFILIYIIFATLGTLLFGVKLKEYKDFFSTCGTLANSFIGKNNVKSMVTAVPTFAELFYFSYMFCVIMTLITIFAAILNKSINEVKQTLNMEYEKLGIKHFIGKVIKDLFGIIFREKKEDRHVSEQANVHQTLLQDGAEAYGFLQLISSSLHSLMKNGSNEAKYQTNAVDCDVNDVQQKSKKRESERKKTLEQSVFARPRDGDFDAMSFKFI